MESGVDKLRTDGLVILDDVNNRRLSVTCGMCLLSGHRSVAVYPYHTVCRRGDQTTANAIAFSARAMRMRASGLGVALTRQYIGHRPSVELACR